jgi:hypothetical protein
MMLRPTGPRRRTSTAEPAAVVGFDTILIGFSPGSPDPIYTGETAFGMVFKANLRKAFLVELEVRRANHFESSEDADAWASAPSGWTEKELGKKKCATPALATNRRKTGRLFRCILGD